MNYKWNRHFSGFKKFIIASVLFHMTVVCLLFLTAYLESEKNKSEIFEISFTDEQRQQPNPEPVTLAETDNANNTLSENAKFLSEKNNTVKKETKAKSGNKFHNAQKVQHAKQQAIEEKIQNNRPQLFENGFDAYASLKKKQAAQQSRQPGSTETSSDESTTNDNLAKIENDLMTRLNTKEYRYYGYYSRIKKQLNQWWVPKVQQKFTRMLSQGRTMASEDNKITKLVIVLNDSGQLVNVQVLAASGVKDLDDAAIEAFRSAAPFPNPPKGMVEKDGTVKIRWDCVVES